MGSTPIISTRLLAAVAELVDALDLKSNGSNIVGVRFSPAAQLSGYNIMVNIRACQARDTGSIPVTRSKTQEQLRKRFF